VNAHVYDARYLAPPGFWELTDEALANIANGCGAKSARIDLVPDCILGADINLACDIHDYAYSLGLDKARADREFLHNLCLACFDDNHVKYTTRTVIAFKYFQAVVLCGDSSFGVKP
jgi:hypothetical protein